MAVSLNTSGERRRGRRFPIQESVQYRLLDPHIAVHGTGRTLNFAAGGIQFTTSEELPVGSAVEVSVDWPATLDGGRLLKFVGIGRVVRSDRHRAAATIERHEFRTRSKVAPIRPDPVDGTRPLGAV
jgi:hypothetical protein